MVLPQRAFTGLEQLARERVLQGQGVVLVDMHAPLDVDADFSDHLHPNDSGYAKLARVWFDALAPLVPQAP